MFYGLEFPFGLFQIKGETTSNLGGPTFVGTSV